MNNIQYKKKKKITCSKKINNNKGFTLIELLAVIIILGVLLLIAVPSISKYIDNSRKKTYINSIKTMVNAVATSVNALDLPFNIGKNQGIIVPFSEVNLEKKTATTKSPYSEWEAEKSFVLVVFDGEMYKYYVQALDKSGYGFQLTYEKSLSTDSIIDDKTSLDSSTISYQEIIDGGTDTAFDTAAATMAYLNNNGNIVKVKIGYSTYKAGDIIQLKDGSKWYAATASTIDDERINLVSYYSMDTTNYGKQNSSNPTIQFHLSQQNPANYDSDTYIYFYAKQIELKTKIELAKNGIDMLGAGTSMPELSDFGCSIDSSSVCANKFVKSDNIPFWTTDTEGQWVYTITSSGIGRANTESTGFGIRIVVRNLLKSNIDKQATKALN